MYDVIDFFKFVAALIVCAVVVMLGLCGTYYAITWAVDRPACAAFERVSGQETFWSFGTSCVVKYQGEWVDYSVATKKKQEVTIKQK